MNLISCFQFKSFKAFICSRKTDGGTQISAWFTARLSKTSNLYLQASFIYRHSAFASAAGINTGPGDGFHQWRRQGIPANHFKWDFLKCCRWYGYFKKFHVIYLADEKLAVHKKREECIERKANCWGLFRFWRVESYCLNVFNRCAECFKAELYKLKCDCTPDKLLKTKPKWPITSLLKCDWFVGRNFTAF